MFLDDVTSVYPVHIRQTWHTHGRIQLEIWFSKYLRVWWIALGWIDDNDMEKSLICVQNFHVYEIPLKMIWQFDKVSVTERTETNKLIGLVLCIITYVELCTRGLFLCNLCKFVCSSIGYDRIRIWISVCVIHAKTQNTSENGFFTKFSCLWHSSLLYLLYSWLVWFFAFGLLLLFFLLSYFISQNHLFHSTNTWTLEPEHFFFRHHLFEYVDTYRFEPEVIFFQECFTMFHFHKIVV